MLVRFPALLGLLVLSSLAWSAEPEKPGPFEVETSTFDWKDAKRDRVVPVRLYVPKGKGPFPVVLFSHGLGGSRDNCAYLGQHWASHGFVSVHMQHKGSDNAVWKDSKQPLEAMKKSLLDPRNALNRPPDVRFVLDQLTKMNQEDGPFKDRLDLEHVGMSGHSFGAWTTQAVIGQIFPTPLGKEIQFTDPRIKAALIMSPNPPSADSKPDKVFTPIKVPCLHLTGTHDDGVLITSVKPADRRIPFENIKAAGQYLVIFKDGTHSVFTGGWKGKEQKNDPIIQGLTRTASTAFWQAYLKDDAEARTWLDRGGLKKTLGEEATLEIRGVTKE
jgi:predicted dienelactone hydrolase